MNNLKNEKWINLGKFSFFDSNIFDFNIPCLNFCDSYFLIFKHDGRNNQDCIMFLSGNITTDSTFPIASTISYINNSFQISIKPLSGQTLRITIPEKAEYSGYIYLFKLT